jgi:hypothetical protein
VPVASADDEHTTFFNGEETMRENNLKKTFNKARAAARKAVSKLPQSTVDGFHRGRQAGHHGVENLPHFAGAAVGFVYGAGEAIVDCAISAISWAWSGTDEGAAKAA